ncbi:MAG: hypothetical protein ACKO0V_06885, partial [bacterium]
MSSWLKLSVLLLPVSVLLITFPECMTQDGPAHLASGKIANELIAGKPVVTSVYRLQLRPLPNWAGQAAAMLSLQFLPERAANCLLNLMGLWLPALGLNWLIQNICPRESYESWARPLWISLSAMNVVWLFGFTSFLIGLALAWVMVSLTYLTIEYKTKILFILTTLGWCILFLSHLVAYCLAGIIFGVILANYLLQVSPKTSLKLAATTIPSLGMLLNYRRMTGESKPELIWEHLDWSNLGSPGTWARQIGWIDPVSLASKSWIPFLDIETGWAIFLQPTPWLAIAASILFFNMIREMAKKSLVKPLPFFVAFVAVGLIGLLGPDTLGRDQGHYLPQRVCLVAMGLFVINWPRQFSPIVTRLLSASWLMQVIYCSVFITQSAALARELLPIRQKVSPGSKLVAIFDATPWPYRANPRLHRDSLLVFAGEDIASWNLYEAGHAYFPVQFIHSPEGLEPSRLEKFSLMLSQ